MMVCPRCNVEMKFNRYQGPLGGYECPSCGLKIDKKTSKWIKLRVAKKK